MKTDTSQSVQSFTITKEMEISAPIEITFEAILAQLGPEGEMPDGKPFPMKIETWPGGRWFRDLGNNAGHLWGHVQAIKPPMLIEISGPLMMSFAASNNLQYRLKAEGGVTKLSFHHSAMGIIPPEYRDDMQKGWDYWLDRIGKLAKSKNRKEA